MWMSNARLRWHGSCNGRRTVEVPLVGHILNRNRASTDTDWGVFSWPWQMFALGKDNPPLSVTSNRCVPVKNTLGCSAYVFFAYKIIQLYSVVFCVVIAVYKFGMQGHNKRNTYQMARWKEGMAVTDSQVFPPTVVTSVKGTQPTPCRSTAFSWAKDVTQASH